MTGVDGAASNSAKLQSGRVCMCAGSAYAVAGPWWASRLQRSSFAARQCSKRGGDLHITVSEADGRVDVAGGAVIVSEGRLLLD